MGYEKVVFLDDAVKGEDVIGKCCDYKAFLKEYDTAVAALGDNGMRLYWTEKLMEAGYKVPAIIHPVGSRQSECSDRERQFYYDESAIVNTHTVVSMAFW